MPLLTLVPSFSYQAALHARRLGFGGRRASTGNRRQHDSGSHERDEFLATTRSLAFTELKFLELARWLVFASRRSHGAGGRGDSGLAAACSPGCRRGTERVC